MSEYIDPTREFDPSLNCPAHFVAGNPECPACVSNQHPNVQRILSYHSLATPTTDGGREGVDFAEAEEHAKGIEAPLPPRYGEEPAYMCPQRAAYNLARAYLALLAERDRLVEVLQGFADDDGYCDFVSIAKQALAALAASPTEVRDAD
jgi:hypothetical protein